MSYGMIHVHSEHSLNDGAMTIHDMIKRAKEMGLSAISLTDHGTCTGIIEFLKETKANQIKGIPGVEAYVKSDATEKRCHMVLLAKNKEGYREISKAVTLSNYQVDTSVPKYAFPMMDKTILKECFGHNNVIGTSACVAGVIGQILLYNYYIDKDIQKIKKKQKRYQPISNNKEYMVILNGKEEKERKIKQLKEQKKKLEIIAYKDYSKREIAVNTMFDFLKNELLKQIEIEKEESQNAMDELAEVNSQLKEMTDHLAKFKKALNKIQGISNKYEEYALQIQKLEEKKKPFDVLVEMAEKELKWYLDLFKNDFYIELQYHGIDMEEIVYPVMLKLAQKLNIPIIATNDAHMVYKEDLHKREYLRSLRYNEWETASPSDAELYMKSDEELALALNPLFSDDVIHTAISNIRVLCDSCQEIDLMNETHYPKYRDDSNQIVPDAPKLLRTQAIDGIKRLFPDGGFTPLYQERLKQELDVIIKMGFADYLLIVADYVNYGKKLAKINNEWKTGYGIGPARGSGAGCLVNYLIGITSIDPIKYGLLFERFLNEERVSMPDIDVDFSKEVREECIKYVTEKYGEKCVAAIRTKMTQAAKASVHNAARLLGDKESHDKTKYLTLGNKIAKEIPFAPNTTFSSKMDNGQTVKNHLLTVFSSNKPAKEIIEMASMTEGAMTNLGVHAAGIVIADGNPLYDYIPVLNMDKSGMAVSCDMVEIEEIGCLKMDFLGLKNLDIISNTMRMIKKNYGISLDMDHLPSDANVYKEIFAKGNTDSVFQFESQGMKKMLREFKPDCFEDIILLVAAYRPGPMQYLDGIIKIKNKKDTPKYLCKELIPILENTYAAIIYQEQVMQIFQKLAGYSLGGADIVRRYMSKKKLAKLEKEKEIFVYGNKEQNIPGCIANGIAENIALELFDQMTDFAKYAFNKSHAAAYAMIAYQTAYLKHYYPAEYMSAVLSYTVFDKLFNLSLECKRMHLPLLVPDVNESRYDFISTKENEILYGFSAIKGAGQIGKKIEKDREYGKYKSFHDFISRVKPKKNEAEALILAGCFDKLYPKQRQELLNILPELSECYAKIEKKTESIKMKKLKMEELRLKIQRKEDLTLSKKELKKIEKSIEVYEKDLLNLQEKWNNIEVLNVFDGPEILEKEREVLGAYVSGHILDFYKHIYTSDVTKFSSFKTGKVTVAGVVRDVKKVKGHVFFLLDDPTGTFHISWFNVKEIDGEIMEGDVVKISGKGEKEMIDEDTEKITVICNKLVFCEKDVLKLIVEIKDKKQFISSDFQNFFSKYISPDGASVLLIEKERGTCRELKAKIHPDILKIHIPIDGVKIHTR